MANAPLAAARLDQDAAWRLFTKGMSPDAARAHARFDGDVELAAGILRMTCIMA
jgi:hypothetical protein